MDKTALTPLIVKWIHGAIGDRVTIAVVGEIAIVLVASLLILYMEGNSVLTERKVTHALLLPAQLIVKSTIGALGAPVLLPAMAETLLDSVLSKCNPDMTGVYAPRLLK